jgi:hypothetical protein
VRRAQFVLAANRATLLLALFLVAALVMARFAGPRV